MAASLTESVPQVGDIFVSSWGYDQTNIDFYQVVGITPSGKSVRVLPIGKKFTEQKGAYGDKVVAVPNDFGPERKWNAREGEWQERKPSVHRIKNEEWSDGPFFNIGSFRSAWPWDGKPTYQTDPVFGH